MKIIKPSVELMKHDTDIYSFIERIGRTCYKSEDKIAEGTAEKFVTQLANNSHYAMMEHEYLYFRFENYNDIIHFIGSCWVPNSHSYNLHKYLNISERYISGSVRAWIEYFDNIHKLSQKWKIGLGIYKEMLGQLYVNYNDLFPLYKDWVDSKDEEGIPLGEIKLVTRQEFIEAKEPDCVYYNLLPHTIKLTVDRAVANEVVRHRPASFAQNSTRYCDYANGKFGSELTFIKPCFWESIGEGSNWFEVCKHAEEAYLDMRENGVKPEEARSILPNSLMTELIVTATEEEWQHIINLRYHGTTGRPHPQMLEVMEMAYPILVKESEGRIK